jgi:hypothetical protein
MNAHTRIRLTLRAKTIRKRPHRRGVAPADSGKVDLTSQKNERLVIFPRTAHGGGNFVPRDLYILAGAQLILVSLQPDALLGPLARLPASARVLVSARPDVAGGPASARFLCVREQPDALALQLASQLRV